MSFPNCPRCHTRFSKKLHRNFFVKYLLPFLKVRRYYCKTCDRNFYVKYERI